MSIQRESIFSIGSRMACRQDSDETAFNLLTTEELEQTLEDVFQKNWTLTLENDLFERYLIRQDPPGLKSVQQILERTKYARKITAHLAPRSSRMSFRESVLSLQDIGRPSGVSTPSITSVHSGSRYATPSLLTTGTFREGIKITLAHRAILANKEIEEMKKRLLKFEEIVSRKKKSLRADMEELDIRIDEACEAIVQFKGDVVKKGIDPITRKIPAEKVVRFVEDWLKTADTIIERLRLKSTTIKSQIKKTTQQLIQREELGEALRAVDFEQLNIENQDYVRKIEEKNHYLLEMKKIIGCYSLKLAQRKQKTKDLLLMLNTTGKEISTKQEQIIKLQLEHETIQSDIENTRGQLISLLTLMENYKVPDILDFVNLQAEFKDLQRTHKRLCRRKNIQQIMFKSHKKQDSVKL